MIEHDIENFVQNLAPHIKQRATTALLLKAKAEIEHLRKDEARLDWLADRNNLIGNITLPTQCVQNNLDSLRAAIDEAMKLDNTD